MPNIKRNAGIPLSKANCMHAYSEIPRGHIVLFSLIGDNFATKRPFSNPFAQLDSLQFYLQNKNNFAYL